MPMAQRMQVGSEPTPQGLEQHPFWLGHLWSYPTVTEQSTVPKYFWNHNNKTMVEKEK